MTEHHANGAQCQWEEAALIRRTLAIATTVVLSASTALSDGHGEILEVSRDFADALNSRNADAVAAFDISDALIMPTDNVLFEGPEGARTQRQGMFKVGVSDTTLAILSIDMFGDMATDYGLWRARAPDGQGGQVDINGKYVHVWQQEDEGWRMRTDIRNNSPAAAE